MVQPDGKQQTTVSSPCLSLNVFKLIESKYGIVRNISGTGYGEVLKQAKGKCGDILNRMPPHGFIHYLEIY